MREIEIKQPLDLSLSLTMGQAFRWQERDDGWTSGFVGPNLIHLQQTDLGIAYRIGGPGGERDATDSDDETLKRYFREDQDILGIYDDIARDPHIAELVDRYWGMRLLRQDPWETLVAYISSANNNIAQISNIVEKISAEFGEAAHLAGEARNRFPDPQQLMSHENVPDRMLQLKLGLRRAPNIVAAAECVLADELDMAALRSQPYASVKRELIKCAGVGNKIADCIALFSLDKLDAFPLDRHIGRALAKWPDCPFPTGSQTLTDGDYRRTVQWAQQHFGRYAGYAGQFLFCDQPK